MDRHQLIVCRIILRFDLLDEQVDQVEQVYLVPLLVGWIVQVEVDVEISLLEDQLD